MTRAAVLGLCAISWLLLAIPSAGASVYFGATISGEVYGHPNNSHAPKDTVAWDRFERHAGKKVAILNQGQGWVSFDKERMEATRARGAIPMVTMGLDAGVNLESVANGSQDAAIKKWAEAAKAWGQPFFLSLWWEMNGNWYSWGRHKDFIAAWRRFHEIVVDEVEATNVTFTWTVNSVWTADPLSEPGLYYPGDAYVDWVGIDSYNWGRSPVQADKWINPEQTLTPTLEAIDKVAPTKPVVIVENASTEYGGNKTDWIREMLTTYLPHHPEIKAYLWFNWNFPKNDLRSDWPIESSAPAQLQFRKAIQGSVFVPGPVSLPALTKVPAPGLVAGDPAQPSDISSAAETVGGPDVAVAPDGTATVVWSSRDAGEFEVFARRIGADGTPAAVQQLSVPGEDALAPQVAVAPDGTATVVWTRSEGADFRIQARRITPSGSPEAATLTLSNIGQDALAPQVDLAADGEATVVWRRFDGFNYLAQARRIDPDGVLNGPAQRLSEPGRNAVEPQVAVAPDGTATVVWSRFDGSDSIVQARRVDALGGLGAIESLSGSGESAIQPQVAADAEGAATVVWTRFNGADWIVQGQRIDPTGVREGGVAELSAVGSDAVEPELAIDQEGAAVIVWTRLAGSDSSVQARRLDAAGAPVGVPLTLSSSGDAADPRLAIAPEGAATVLWSRFDGLSWRVQRRDFSAGGTLGAIETLSAAGRSAGDPAIAWGGDGTLAMTWKRTNAGGEVIQAKTVPLPDAPPPPPPPPTDPPAGGSASGGAGGGEGSSAPDIPRVDNAFRISDVSFNRKRGRATLAVVVPGPGEVSLRGAVPQRRQTTSPAQVLLRVVPKAGKRRLLSRRGSLRMRVTVVFAPAGGEVNSKSLSLRLRKAPVRR